MSKNITIQEGGAAKQLTVDKLKTNVVGGGTCLWVPEDETRLGTKHITENGTYNADDDGYYGYSQVVVNIANVGMATGKDKDGDEAVVYTDPETGELVEEKMPSYIAIDTPPTKTDYYNGETINFSGMVVKAYLKTGDLWTNESYPDGIIPLSELQFPVTIADASEVQEQTASSDLQTDPASPIRFGSNAIFKDHHQNVQNPNTDTYTCTEAKFVLVQMTDRPNNMTIIAISSQPGAVANINKVRTIDATGEIQSDETDTLNLVNQYTYGGKTAYYGVQSYLMIDLEVITPSPEHLNSSRQIKSNTIAWTILYGTIEGGAQAIPVQWTRPKDSNILETSFNITVT